ncbi:MAG TPA: glycosyltransferase family 2 protein [Nitrospiria bacterium]|nr:glycosyltransferase family 2 protein [Nitrospiria bacterium]
MVYVLIPAHNGKDDVLRLLGCLGAQAYREFKIVLMDDGSTDGTAAAVALTFPNVTVLRGNGRLWWTGAIVCAVTHILREAKEGDFILLLNSDLTIDPDYVGQLVEASRAHGRCLVGSTNVDADNPRSMHAGVWMDDRLRLTVNSDEAVIRGGGIDDQVDVLPGRGTLIPVEVFNTIGGFNARILPHYGADYEFSIRARRAGFRLIVSHRARVYSRRAVTGYDIPDKGRLSIGESMTLLFSTKSKTNARYFLAYVWLCSNDDVRIRNTLAAAMALMTRIVLRTGPFYPLYLMGRSIRRLGGRGARAMGGP